MILTIEHGAVRELRLNRPPVNALAPELIRTLLYSVKRAPQEGKRALLLSGLAGVFSAGLDLPVLIKLDRPAIDAVWRDFYALMNALASSPIPVAAAITDTLRPEAQSWRFSAIGELRPRELSRLD
jgi:Delta3-Delta2-enoyl-CoA isomerase